MVLGVVELHDLRRDDGLELAVPVLEVGQCEDARARGSAAHGAACSGGGKAAHCHHLSAATATWLAWKLRLLRLVNHRTFEIITMDR